MEHIDCVDFTIYGLDKHEIIIDIGKLIWIIK